MILENHKKNIHSDVTKLIILRKKDFFNLQ
jgi:hypothetical protein